MPAYGLYARHVHGLELANVSVGFEQLDMRPAMVCLDVDGLEIDNFKAQYRTQRAGGQIRRGQKCRDPEFAGPR